MTNEINIAWIDDDIHIIDPVVEPLERAGYKIRKINSLDEARNSITDNNKFDLILLDLLLPDKSQDEDTIKYSGKELLEELRNDKKITTPVIVFSVVNRSAILDRIKEIGVDDILHKPIRPLVLKERVESVLRNHKLI